MTEIAFAKSESLVYRKWEYENYGCSQYIIDITLKRKWLEIIYFGIDTKNVINQTVTMYVSECLQ